MTRELYNQSSLSQINQTTTLRKNQDKLTKNSHTKFLLTIKTTTKNLQPQSYKIITQLPFLI